MTLPALARERGGMTHAQLVARAAQWLRGSRRCGVVLTERLALGHCAEQGAEMPDAIGWPDHRSIMVECKTSLSDMTADRRKKFRRWGGAGDAKYIMCAKGVIQPADIYPGWGLLWVCGKVVRHIVRPRLAECCAMGLRRERYLLTAEVMRLNVQLQSMEAKRATA